MADDLPVEIALPPDVSSVGVGRRVVRQALAAWQLDELIDTATLLTSEVLTNSVLHARTNIVLTVRQIAEDRVSISVHDDSSHLPRMRRHSAEATTGRGLELLDQLADEWAVEAEPGGKTLTFSIGGGADPWAAYTVSTWEEHEL